MEKKNYGPLKLNLNDPLDYKVAVRAAFVKEFPGEVISYLFYEAFGYENKMQAARKSIIRNHSLDPKDPQELRKLLYIVHAATPPREKEPLIEYLLLSEKAPERKRDAAMKKLEQSVQRAMML